MTTKQNFVHFYVWSPDWKFLQKVVCCIYGTFQYGIGGGGGGYSPQILVGNCRGKVKNGPGLRNELSVERENAGLRNEL